MKRIINKIKHELLRHKVKKTTFRYGITRKKRNVEIIVSLTTFPKRFDGIELCLKSLLNQTIKPDRIIIWLGSDSPDYLVDEKLGKYKNYGVEIIKDYNLNLKSHKKYYYAFKNFPDSIIITVDDDLIYPLNMIEELYKEYLIHQDCIIGRRVHLITWNGNKINKYKDWIGEYNKIEEPSHNIFVTTGAGTLFPPNILKKYVLEQDLIAKYAPTADDVWINLIALKNKVKKVWQPNKMQMPTTIFNSQHTNLTSQNVDEDLNDKYIEQIMNDFNITKKDFDD